MISLPESASRRSRVERHLTRLGIPFTFLDATRPADLSEAQLAARVDQAEVEARIGRPVSAPEIGCSLSHVDALRRLVESGEPCAVVLEDDVRLADSAGTLIARVAATVEPGDLVLIGAAGARR